MAKYKTNKEKRMLGKSKEEIVNKPVDVIREERITEADTMANSWKDEAIVLIVFSPILITFVSALFTGGMEEAWKVIGALPTDGVYGTLVLLITLVTFGLKSIILSVVEHVIRVREHEKGIDAEDEDVRDRALMKLLDARIREDKR